MHGRPQTTCIQLNVLIYSIGTEADASLGQLSHICHGYLMFAKSEGMIYIRLMLFAVTQSCNWILKHEYKKAYN